MDSWSRPNKSSATPPPLYITDPNTTYCKSCGRVISDRKSHRKTTSKPSNRGGNQVEEANVVKYCSDGCRKRRIGPLDKRIDRAIFLLLQGESDSGIETIDVKSRMKKGDHRNLISTDEIERVVFSRTKEAPDTAADGTEVEIDEQTDPYEVVDEASLQSQGNRPNPEGPGSTEKQREGQRRANEREAVRRAARRAVVFGFQDPADVDAENAESLEDRSKRKCEAVINGQVVEPSYAKGNWYIRWRE